MSAASAVGSSVVSSVASSVTVGQGGFDSDAVAYFAAVEAAGGSFDLTSVDAAYTSSYVKQAHSRLFAGLKSDGLWSKITELYLLSGKTYAGMAVKAKGTSTLTLTNFVSGDYVSAGSGAGLKGNGSNKYANTNATAEAVGDSGIFGYVTIATTGTFDTLLGIDSSNAHTHYLRTTGSITTMNFSSDAGTTGASSSPVTTGLISGVESATTAKLYLNGSKIVETSVVARTANSNKVFLFALGRNNSPADYGDYRATILGITKALTDTDVANLSTRINAFMTVLGANVY